MAFEPPAISSISVQLPAGMSEQCILRASSLNGWMSELELVWLAITAHIKGGDIEGGLKHIVKALVASIT